MAQARLATIELPDFGMPDERPEIPAALHLERVARLRERVEAPRLRPPGRLRRS